MSLPPKYSGHCLTGTSLAEHTLELYLDYVCPFSARIWKQVYHHVVPWLEQEHPGKVQVIVRNQIQPWHPSSTLTAEAALAVESIDPAQFASFSDVLFTHQKNFFDESVIEKSRRDQYETLATLATTTLPKSSSMTKERILALLYIPAVDDAEKSTNTGNKVAADLKYFIKLGRQTGIHVSPTALWDGLVENAISSGWTLDAWKEFLSSKF
ncbi:hypothetical protein BGZ93_010757 [Podila epicladia]|nr:hypothetical protein BGZ92_011914 [Podila epicladia]KAG0087747.1 hypothetical protein BGZ93_010757 [Podila epicladia]